MLLDVSQQGVVVSVLYGNNETSLNNSGAHDTTNATAQQIAQAILHANVSSQQAVEQSIAQSIASVSTGSDPAIIIQAAVLGNETEAVNQAFQLVSILQSVTKPAS